MAQRHYKSISVLLEQILGKKAWKGQLQEAEIKLRWPEIVGPEIAARTQPKKLYKNKLEVHCDHDVWRSELQFLKPEILKRIAEIEGEGVVKEIYLK
jgi:predicted nucleic acid-binding Zn ribbon protein